MLPNSFDIYSDFYSDPEIRLAFKEEYDLNIPSTTMWALVLYVHPRSKFSELDPATKEALIKKDYLEDPDFDFNSYLSTIDKIQSYLPTTADRFIST